MMSPPAQALCFFVGCAILGIAALVIGIVGQVRDATVIGVSGAFVVCLSPYMIMKGIKAVKAYRRL
jgi:hypothetical protein